MRVWTFLKLVWRNGDYYGERRITVRNAWYIAGVLCQPHESQTEE
jgi:hypothetical protein